MKLIGLIILAFSPFLLMGQREVTDSGIQFVHGLSWRQVLQRAKSENKYIFVDFYATWCGPCKEMDEKIYPLKNVGDLFNKKFIAVRIQVDKSSSDDGETRSWYHDADSLSHQYHVGSLPSLIFLSPDCQLITKEEGYKSEDDFVALLNHVVNTRTGYANLIGLYRIRNLPDSQMRKLALEAKRMGDNDLADTIAQDYKVNMLDKLSDTALLTEDNVRFITNFPSLISAGDRFFIFFYHHGTEAEHLANARPGYANDLVKSIIVGQEINPHLYRGKKEITKEPDWESIYINIETKYGKKFAEELVTSAKLRFFQNTEDWKQYSDIYDKKIKAEPLKPGSRLLGGWFFDDAWTLNVIAWDLFLHCKDRSVLKRALAWSKLSISLCVDQVMLVQLLDTKANLLYKLSKKKQGIKLEEKVLKAKNSKEYRSNLERMKNGMPTWPT
jgi:thioredoxin-related protein